MQHSKNQHSTFQQDRDNNRSMSPVSQIDPEQQEWLDRRDDIRQSKSFRQTPKEDKELENMVYYDLNNRLKEQKRKLTP